MEYVYDEDKDVDEDNDVYEDKDADEDKYVDEDEDEEDKPISISLTKGKYILQFIILKGLSHKK